MVTAGHLGVKAAKGSTYTLSSKDLVVAPNFR